VAGQGGASPAPAEVRRAHLAMVALGLLVSTSYSVGALLAPTIAPIPLTFMRFVLASGVFAVVMVASRTPFTLDRGLVFRAGVVGLIFVAFFVSMFKALETVTPLSTGAIFALVPLLSAAIGWLVLGRRLSPAALLLLVVAGLGAVWVVFGGSLARLRALALGHGELVYFLGCIAYAAYPTFLQKTARGDPPVRLTFLSFLAAVVLLLLWDAPGILATRWTELAGWQWLGLIWLAAVPTSITFYLLQYASLRLTPAKVMAYTYLTPAGVMVIESLLGHGLPGLSVMAGIAVTLAALWAFERS